MVEITNGLQTVVVSSGAFREIYQPQGWLLSNKGQELTPIEALVNQNVAEEEKSSTTDDQQDYDDPAESGEDTERDSESNEDETEEPEDELLLRPLSDLTLNELKKVAGYKGVDIDGCKDKKAIRQAIRDSEKL